MNIVTYNLRFGGKNSNTNHWGKVMEEFSPDLFFAQETNEPSTYFTTNHQKTPQSSIVWQPTSSGWGSSIFSSNKKLIPIKIPSFEGWVVGAKIENFSTPDGQVKPLFIFSVHTPSPGDYEKKSLSILNKIKEISKDHDLIIAGDFNITTAIRHPSEELKNTTKELEFITQMRKEFGLVNCWQAINPNRDLPQTLRWSGKQDAPYHCDGIFIPLSWVKHIEQCTILNTDNWLKMSDHYPIFLQTKA